MDLALITPEITLFSGAIAVLMADVFFAKKRVFDGNFYLISYLISLVFCAFTAILLFKNIYIDGKLAFNKMFLVNPLTNYTKLVILFLLTLIIYISRNFLNAERKVSGEFLALLMIATTGSMLLVSANDLMSLYLAIELQALSLYLLAAIKRDSLKSSESGMKYFILGSVASGILLFGISMIYGFAGSTNFQALRVFYSHRPDLIQLTILLGFVMVITAMFFKISAAPFHMWTVDVYEGSSSIVTIFFATIVKLSAVIILIRIFTELLIYWAGIGHILIFSAILSLIIGSFGAIRQHNLKRLLAYSSIGHIGFVLLAIGALSYDGIKSAILYILVYVLVSVGTFAFLNLIEDLSNESKEKINLDQKNNLVFDISSLAGLSKTNPVMAFCLAILMFSTAGIPPLAGFFAKFYVFSAFIGRGYITLAVIAILFSVISAYYYLRIVKIMYFDQPKSDKSIVADNFNIKLVIFLSAMINLFFVVFLNQTLMTIADILKI
jgi:NADH-quinone oxidoreductase subunit N